MGKDADKIKSDIETTKAKIASTVGQITDVRDSGVADVRATAADTVTKVSTLAGETAGNVGTSLQNVQSKVLEKMPGDGAPLPLLLAGAAAGIVAGLLIPLSAIERERLRPIGDQILRRGLDARDEVVSQGKAVVKETVDAAKSSFQQHSREAAENLGVSETDA